MDSVYLLGHRVGNIDEPVVYVHHKVYDYNGNVVREGIPDAFIFSIVSLLLLTQNCVRI